MLFLMICKSDFDVKTLILSGEILMILSSDLTISKFSTMSLKVSFINIPLERSTVSNEILEMLESPSSDSSTA